MRTWTYRAASETATERLGGKLAAALEPGSVVALVGPLGAGKTRLVQAVAAALGADRRTVASPTFVLIHEYRGRFPIYHFDAYRLSGTEEFLELGPEEYFAGSGVTFVEWADRVADALPSEHLRIEVEITGPEARTFRLHARGAAYEAMLQKAAHGASKKGDRPNREQEQDRPNP